MNVSHQKIAVLDFGGQYAHLIANRVRRLGVFSEIVDADTPAKQLKNYKGLIFSGGPMSVYANDAPHPDMAIFALGIPILGICYGHQVMQHLLGGKVAGHSKEYGLATLSIVEPVGLFEGVRSNSRVWMSHGDTVEVLAPGFIDIACTEDAENASVADVSRHFYGTQFHVEVTHTEDGMKILENFMKICEVSRDWSITQFIQEEMDAIKDKVKDKKVFMLVSGGVDSTVAFALLEKALGKDRVYGLLVDHGMMRLNEATKVQEALTKTGFDNLHVTDKADEFLSALAGKTEPETKRRIIGDLFWKVKEDVTEALKLNPDEWIMGQGTIYPDTIETGGSKHADTIKTHHNRVDLVQEMITAGKVIEPLAQLYKDEVRTLGEQLGLPHDLVWRQPFPGPGLGVRILCSAVDGLFDAELSRTLQMFVRDYHPLNAVAIRVLPIQSVGVQGDERTYRHPCALFTDSRDWNVLEKVSTDITNKHSDINRVLLCLSGESADFKVKACDLNRDRIRLLQNIDALVTRHMANAPSGYDIWQFPVVLVPVSTEQGKESIVLRPVISTEAMTAGFARIDRAVLEAMTAEILKYEEITHVFYDITHKPPGTIEWE